MYNTGYPWLPRKAVEFLEDYLTEDMNVLEFGSGASTIWIAKRVKRMISIEHNRKWWEITIKRVSEENIDNVEVWYSDRVLFEVDAIDFILVDGGDRVGCFKESIKFLNPGGAIMLDNSEREEYAPCFDMVKGWKQYEAYGPDYTGTFDYENWKCSWWIK